MNQEMFLAELRTKLRGLPQNELEERIAFYREMIEDRISEGIPEEEAVAGIGTVGAVADQIMSEIPLTKLVGEKMKREKSRSGGEIALLVLGSPLWLPLLVTGAVILLSLYVVLWSVVICLWAADLAFAAGVFGGLAGAVQCLETGNLSGTFFFIGGSLVCFGMAVLLFYVSLWFSGCVLKLGGKALLAMKNRFAGKED